jgi:hypothetical protein
MKLPKPYSILAAAGIALTGTGGYLVSEAFSAGAPPAETTTTVTLTGGPTGPAGPKGPPGNAGPTGPAGPAGATECPAGFKFGDLVINHPGGQVTIFTCIKS